MATSLEDVKSSRFWRGTLAELLGTLILVLVGCGTCVGPSWQNFQPTSLQISFAFGLAVATSVWCISHVAGAGHINPAVTLAMFCTGKISAACLFIFIVAQCVGAIIGAAILLGITPSDTLGNLGVTDVGPGVTSLMAFFTELCITFVLVFTVFASCDTNRTNVHGSPALAIGLSVTICHMFAISCTGSSMNPARSFGPAVIMNSWHYHWVYWVGPLVGGVLAGFLYELVFAADASLNKVKNFLHNSAEFGGNGNGNQI